MRIISKLIVALCVGCTFASAAESDLPAHTVPTQNKPTQNVPAPAVSVQAIPEAPAQETPQATTHESAPVSAPVNVVVEDSLTLPPAPVLVAPHQVPKGAGPAMNVDQTIADMRMALRRRAYAQAEAYLAMLPSDAAGYKDLIKELKNLRDEQHAAYQALEAGLKQRHCGELAGAVSRAARYSDLGAATAQCQAYIELIEGVYDRGFTQINSAVSAHDAALARKWLDKIPTDRAVLPLATAIKRDAAVQALGALEKSVTPH